MTYEEFANAHPDKSELCIRKNRTTSLHAGDAVRTYIDCLSYQKATYDRTNTPEYVAMQKELAATLEFVKNSGAENILYADSEFENPYKHKNKVLALIGSWGEAISDTEVNLNYVLISNVPAESVGSGHCMMIVNVLGIKEINLSGKVIVPNVEFRQQRCNIPCEVLIEAASNRS